MSALSVVICTHNPDAGRLRRTLAALRTQTLPAANWETLLIDNASQPALVASALGGAAPENLRILAEPQLGLTHARRAGLRAAAGEIVVFVDDDNVLAPDYLGQTLAAFARLPRVGALGGKSLPEYERPEDAAALACPDDWRREFLPLLALRDLGDNEKISTGMRPPGAPRNVYPDFAPIGAGLALRRAAAHEWLTQSASTALSDRRGRALSSAGDNDLVFSILRAGWEVAYVPALTLTHLIPAARLEPSYLARLNRGIQTSWMQVLTLHDANPWPLLTPLGVRLRKLKAWLTHRPWRGPAQHVRYAGACGHFEGRVKTSVSRA